MSTSFALGRHVEHDPKSRAFLARMVEIPRTVLHAHNAPVLDQGKVGSCTGHTMAQALNTEFFNTARTGGTYLNDTEAVALYSAASFIDDIPGGYLPDDTGSSGLAVAKAAQQRRPFEGLRPDDQRKIGAEYDGENEEERKCDDSHVTSRVSE